MNEQLKKQKYFTYPELKSMGYSYYQIGKLAEEGFIYRVNRSTFENLNYEGEENDFYTAKAFVPFGVICLLSAARYYELTTFLPDAVDVAIHRKQKVSTLPDWPELKIRYYAPQRMRIGIQEVQEGHNSFRIFDLEKTVVDILYYRNKIGVEESSEVLRNYLKRQNRKLDKLYSYAKRLGSEEVLRTYLEVLL